MEGARGVAHHASSAPSGRLSTQRLAWRHLRYDRGSAAGVAAALLLALLPAAVLGVERSSTASELRSLLSRSGGLSVESRAAVDAQGFDAFQGQVSALVDSRMARYLDGAAEEATVGPVPLDPGRSPDHAPLLASASVTVAYVSDL